MLLAKRRMRVGARDGGRGDDVIEVKVLVTTCHWRKEVNNLEGALGAQNQSKPK